MEYDSSEEDASNTPYDDVFRTLLNDCSELIVPVINEIFGESYTGRERIVFAQNEHFLNRQGGAASKRITDASFEIIGTETKKYLCECQSTPDSSMLVRIFEYATQIALDEGEIIGNVLKVRLPHSAVLFLRSRKTTPDKMKIEMETPGGRIAFDILVMKVQRYALREIFEKGLLFLIPFYIFSHEPEFPVYNTDVKRLESLKAEYVVIVEQLDHLLMQGKISVYARHTLMELSNKVLEHIAKKYDKVREGVKAVMGGRILEYEAKTIKNEGRREGTLETLVGLVKDGLISVKEAASRANLSEEAFRTELGK